MARRFLVITYLYLKKNTKAVLCYTNSTVFCFLLFFFLLFVLQSNAQELKNKREYTIYGIVKDKISGESLYYANLLETLSGHTSITNDYGFYSLTLQSEFIKLQCSYIGYENFTVEFILNKDTLINIELKPVIKQLNEVIITDSVKNRVFHSQISIQNIPLKDANQLPVLFGEVDLLKTVQLFPGIQSGHEGSSGIYVRGGSGDQNLYIIEGTPVYNITHLLGFVSVINEDAVSSMNVVTGGFPARYHGRISSVVDIKTKEGNLNKYEGGFSIGLLATKFNFNGPIKKGKGSFFVSGRRSYIDWLARPIIKEIADGALVKLFFYDLNGKVNYRITKNSHIYLSSYFGKDVYNKNFSKNEGSTYENFSKDGLKWGNFVSSLRWNYLWSNKLFSNLTVSYTRYNYVNEKTVLDKLDNIRKEYNYSFNSGINDLSSRLTFDYFPRPQHTVKFGLGYTYHIFSPGITTEYSYEQEEMKSQRDTTYGYIDIYAPEFTAFIEDTWEIKNKWVIRSGISTTMFSSTGKTWTSIEPRLSINYAVTPSISIKAAYARMAQFMHLLRFSTVNMPTDFWIPAIKNLPPELSDQFTLGVFYSLENMFEFSLEAYYKNMDNLTEYKEGASFFSGDSEWESKIEIGRGWSYGVELMAKKNFGRLNGWVSYTWSKSERLFSNINFGEPFPFRFDRRHDLGIVANYRINKKINGGITWVFGSGYPVTLFTEKYASYFLSVFGGQSIPNGNFASINSFPFRNNYRMPAFHHLDVSLNFHKNTKFGERIISVGIYNVYNRLNAFYLKERDGRLYKVSLFPILPFIRFTLKFY